MSRRPATRRMPCSARPGAVRAVGALAAEWAGGAAGLVAALVLATTPVFLFQAMQPMSDVPAAALWMLALAAVTGTRPRAPLVAGLATAAAVLMRPNLVPLAIPHKAATALLAKAASAASWSVMLLAP